mgnify:CR=1 FL=1
MEIDFIQELKKRDADRDPGGIHPETERADRISRGSYLKDHRYRRQCLA